MDRNDFVLAVLCTAPDAAWTPVQVQKLFFLIDKKVGNRVGGPWFSFEPYDYGPFDADVYREIENLAADGLAHVDRPPFGMRTFSVTPQGLMRGSGLLERELSNEREYVRQLSSWVRALPFQQLVSAVYREYPEMRANSVFRE